MEYRVDELAAAAGVAVDTIRFYQSQRLLPPPARRGRVVWYDQTHLDRLRRIRDLKRHELLAERGIGAGHRTGRADLDLGERGRRHQRNGGNGQRAVQFLHPSLPVD